MKRGRRQDLTIQLLIFSTLNSSEMPLTIEKMKKKIYEKELRNISWNSLKKHAEQLVLQGKIFKKMDGKLTLYWYKPW
jgi:hypothetical protein